MSEVDSLHVSLNDDLAEIARLAELVEAFGERHALPMKAIFNLNLALDELITNTISYGLVEGGERTIEVRLRLEPGRLTTELEDAGRPFDPFSEAATPDLSATLEERRVGGLGVHLVKSLMDEVGYDRRGDRNHITLRQRL